LTEALDDNVAVLMLLAAGRVPPDVLCAFASVGLVPFEKETGGTRPIACGTLPRRLIAKSIAHVFGRRVAAALGPTQFAVARPGGAESWHKLVVTHLSASPGSCLLGLDIEGAHANADRGQVLTATCAATAPGQYVK
jgi:hypothetical protein